MPGIIDRAWHDLQTSTKSNHVRVAEVYFLTNHRILNEKLLVMCTDLHHITEEVGMTCYTWTSPETITQDK